MNSTPPKDGFEAENYSKLQVFTGSYVVGPILCFFLFESLWCLNEVAKEAHLRF